MDELIGEFLGETSESLDVIDNELVKFEAVSLGRGQGLMKLANKAHVL